MYLKQKKIFPKTFVFFIGLLFFITKPNFAQTFKSGLIAGFNVSQISGDDLGGYDKPGPVFGMFLNHELKQNWQLELQMIYIQKGSRKYPDIKNGDNSRYILNLNYIELPLLVRYKFKKIFLLAGVSYGVMFKQYVGNEFGEYPLNTSPAAPFNKWELSYNLGASYSISKHFEIEGKINHSMLPVRINRPYELHWVDKGQFNDLLIWVIKYKF
jgi:hypothetical protein